MNLPGYLRVVCALNQCSIVALFTRPRFVQVHEPFVRLEVVELEIESVHQQEHARRRDGGSLVPV